MQVIQFRMLSLFALTALVTGAWTLPTPAKQPFQTQTQPVLIAQSASEPSIVLPDDANTNTLSQFGTFLDTASPNATITITIPVTDFTYHNGKVNPAGSPPFPSFISEYGSLGIVPTESSSAFSSQTPVLTQPEINNLKSVTVSFDYASTSTLYLLLHNKKTGKNIIITTLPGTDSKVLPESVSIPTTDFVGGDVYQIVFFLRNGQAGFGNNNNISPVNVGDVLINLIQK